MKKLSKIFKFFFLIALKALDSFSSTPPMKDHSDCSNEELITNYNSYQLILRNVKVFNFLF